MSHIIIKAYFVPDISVKYYSKIICLWLRIIIILHTYMIQYIHTII